jgi:nicotinate-nucleotide adenylyltransferase
LAPALIPPHAGHQGILAWLGQEYDHVAVWAADNPFKADQSPLADRMEMLRLLISTLKTTGTVQLHPELSHRFTLVTLERAQQQWPQADFTLVIGADLVAQLPKWYQAQAIFERAQILVFPRPGYPLVEEQLRVLRERGARVAIATPPQQYDISSSAYRQAETDYGIPPIIQTYIEQHNLYPCPENSREKLSTH